MRNLTSKSIDEYIWINILRVSFRSSAEEGEEQSDANMSDIGDGDSVRNEMHLFFDCILRSLSRIMMIVVHVKVR